MRYVIAYNTKCTRSMDIREKGTSPCVSSKAHFLGCEGKNQISENNSLQSPCACTNIEKPSLAKLIIYIT